MNLGPLADMHPVDQAIRTEIGAKCYDDEPVGMALLAVLDLHPPHERTLTTGETRTLCRECYRSADTYPCPTVERIADALGVTC